MSELVSSRRRAATGLVSMVVGAAALFWAFPGNAGANESSVRQTPPSSEEFEGNPTCPEGLTEFKIDPPADGEHSDGTLTVNITLNDTDEGQTVDWTSDIGVDVVIVKGGNGAIVYTYDPEATAGTGLHAPVAGGSGKWADVSHISFCYDEDEGTTTTEGETTTTEASTTTTEASTTTVGEETTTTAGEETTTTVKAAEDTTTTVVAAPTGELPKTGSGTQVLLTIAGLILLVGGAALTASRVAKLRRLT